MLRHRIRTAVGAFIVAVVVVAGALPAAGVVPRSSSNVTARDAANRLLPPDPTLHVRETVTITVTRFAPLTDVVVRMAGTLVGQHVRADAAGVVRYVLWTGALPAVYRLLTFVGLPPDSAYPRVGADPNADSQFVTAIVPNVGLFPYRIADPGQGGGGGGSHGGGSHGGGGSGAGGVASTGFDVAAWLHVVTLLLGVGGLALVASRRGWRRRPQSSSR